VEEPDQSFFQIYVSPFLLHFSSLTHHPVTTPTKRWHYYCKIPLTPTVAIWVQL